MTSVATCIADLYTAYAYRSSLGCFRRSFPCLLVVSLVRWPGFEAADSTMS